MKYPSIGWTGNHKASLPSGRDSIEAKGTIAMVLLMLMMSAFALISPAASLPEGPTVTYIFNQTNAPDPATIINTTGGTITTVTLNATTQNIRWKAYVGNVTGKFTLDDGSGSTIYDWITTSPQGEIYATRTPDTISWASVQCANLTHMENENRAMNHTMLEDNITSTFSSQLHRGFYVGTNLVSNNTCFSVHTYVNSTAQASIFEEVVLYDGTTESNGNILYATMLEQDAFGFNGETYDFQIIIPENGQSGWTSSTGYYFYVELG